MSSLGYARRVFVDTSVYYAGIDRRDAYHTYAGATMRQLITEGRPLVTTNIVLFRLHGPLLNRINRRVAWDSFRELRLSQTIVRVRVRDEARAEDILAQYADKDFSLTDATSFAVIERLGVSVAFSLDHHFAQYGWVVLPLETPA